MQLSVIVHGGISGFRWQQPVLTTVFETIRRGPILTEFGLVLVWISVGLVLVSRFSVVQR